MFRPYVFSGAPRRYLRLRKLWAQSAPAWILAMLLCACGAMSGCGYLFGGDGVFRDTSNDYREARETPPLALPDGLKGKELVEVYAIPKVESDPQFTPGGKTPRPAPLVSASAEQLVRIQKLGNDSWALIGIAPGQLWPQLRSFLSAANIDIARMDARAGIIESSYLDLKEVDRPTRFRFRVERGVQRGNSELHVRQMYQRSTDEWPLESDDIELESELLRGVAQYIANSADTAPVSMMAEQSISASGKVALRDDDMGDYIELELPFERAWASVSRSLDLSGFEITDRNRSEGRYFIRYQTGDDDKKSGWFGWLSGGGDEHPAAGVPLLLSVETAEPERMVIRLVPEDPQVDLQNDELQSLLVLIKGNIN